jgi:hypothetical protein
MTDQNATPDSVPTDLQQARIGLLGATAGLVRFAQSLPRDSVERNTVRQAIQEASSALKRIYPAVAESAHAHALHTLEIRPPGEEPTPISGETLELYAAELCKFLLAYGEEDS